MSSEIEYVWALPDGTPLSDRALPFISLDDPPLELVRAVVPVLARVDDQTVKGIGTAFCVGFVDTGCALFLTASHVVDDLVALGKQGFVVLPGAFEKRRARHFRSCSIAKTTMFPRTNHIALIAARIENGAMSPLAFPVNVDRPVTGDHCVAYGYSVLEPGEPIDDFDNQEWQSEIDATRGDIEDVFASSPGMRIDFPAIQIGAHFPSGMSGGPVVDRAGTVIGVVCDGAEMASDFTPFGYAALIGAITELVLSLPIDSDAAVDVRADQMARNGWIRSSGGACRVARYGDEGIELFWPPYPEDSGPTE